MNKMLPVIGPVTGPHPHPRDSEGTGETEGPRLLSRIVFIRELFSATI